MSELKPDDTSNFRVGDLVRRRSSPNIVGQIRSVEWDEQTESWRCRVQIGSSLRGIPASDLEALPDEADPWTDAISLRLANATAFRSRLTYERLRKPPSRIAASFGSARAAFYPYQFKPLLKFLENRRQRLLIADDVGLGKTIEAGYILREIRARHGLERVLIVVPARLQSKWKAELDRKFDETFEIVRSRDILRLKHTLARNDEPEAFRWITSYEAARHQDVISMLSDYEPPIDLVIVDEAHRMRNPSTLQHQLGRVLATSADAMILLTATPTQTGLADVFNLLRLLDPEEFADFESFRDQADANKRIVRLAQMVRQPDVAAAAALIREIVADPRNRQIVRSEFFESIVTRTVELANMSRDERIELQRDIAELGMTSHILSRTRKADVLPDRPQRKAQALVFDLTEAEQHVYDSVADLCRQIRPDLSDWGLTMSITMAYRYTASCIPAARALFAERLSAAEYARAALRELDSTEQPIDPESPGTLEAVAGMQSDLARVARDAASTESDSKFVRLKIALDTIAEDDRADSRAPRKILIFSYFKRTLRYLSQRLQQLGIVHGHIDGDIAIADREVRIEQFSTDPAIRILLSSEVGSEGLDLQAASVVVNYDLPWNPMVVEQRIGRIDRLLQKSPTLTILNLVAKGTIEERILLRLYERIGIFEDTIGDIDPILGERIEELALDALRGKLSPEEERQRIDQTVEAIRKELIQANDLGQKADALLAADQAFLDEIESLVGKRRIPSPTELYEFVAAYLRENHTGARLPRKVVTDVVEVRLPPDAGAAMRKALGTDAEITRASRKIEAGPFTASFDQQAAMNYARAELIHARHPLVRLAFASAASRASTGRAFALRLDASTVASSVRPGLYAFSIWLFDLQGARDRVEIVPFFAEIDGEQPLSISDAEPLYLEMLGSAGDLAPLPLFDQNLLPGAIQTLQSAARSARQTMHARESSLDDARKLRRKTTLAATLQARIDSALKRVRDLQRKDAAPFAIAMAGRRHELAITRMQTAMSDLSSERHFAIEDEEIAVGLLLVENAESPA